MQIDQLFEFVYILIDKKQVTAKEMSEYFGVSTRTVYRWIAALSVSGVPIYSLKGRWKNIWPGSKKYRLAGGRFCPLEAGFPRPSWYLLGWCTSRKAERYFKLTRMQNLTMTFKNANISSNMMSSKPAQMPEYSAPLIQIKAKVTQKKISYLMDSFICSEIKAQKNDWVNVTFTAPDTLLNQTPPLP